MFVFFSSDLRPQPHILWQPRGWVCPTYPASAPSTTTWSILIISNKDCQRTSSIQEEFTKPCLNMICQVSVWILTLQYSSSTDMGQEVFHSIFTEEIQGSITKYLISFLINILFQARSFDEWNYGLVQTAESWKPPQRGQCLHAEWEVQHQQSGLRHSESWQTKIWLQTRQ